MTFTSPAMPEAMPLDWRMHWRNLSDKTRGGRSRPWKLPKSPIFEPVTDSALQVIHALRYGRASIRPPGRSFMSRIPGSLVLV